MCMELVRIMYPVGQIHRLINNQVICRALRSMRAQLKMIPLKSECLSSQVVKAASPVLLRIVIFGTLLLHCPVSDQHTRSLCPIGLPQKKHKYLFHCTTNRTNFKYMPPRFDIVCARLKFATIGSMTLLSWNDNVHRRKKYLRVIIAAARRSQAVRTLASCCSSYMNNHIEIFDELLCIFLISRNVQVKNRK